MLVLALVAAWAAGALYFDLPFPRLRLPAALLFGAVMACALFFTWPLRRKAIVMAAGFALVLCWWLTIRPRSDRNWQPDVAETAWAEIDGDNITIHNVRNCDYRAWNDYTPRWETRTVRLSQITGMDLFIDYWGTTWIAHPIVSFQFADAPPLAMSIEVRKRVGQEYSPIGGFYRQFELIYIAADERDVVRVRTNYLNEDLYLYHLNVSPGDSRDLFLDYIATINKLHEQPRWYNAVAGNCTTCIGAQKITHTHIPWDWRILLNGKGDRMLYEHGLLAGDLPFDELKHRSLIDAAAKAAGSAPDFSALVRAGLPGFAQAPTDSSH